MKINFSYIPELQFLDKWMIENPGKYQEVIDQYQEVINFILQVSSGDIDTIRRARGIMKSRGMSLHSASKLDTSDFLEKIIKRNTEVTDTIGMVFGWDRDTCNNLQRMLEKGSQLAKDTANIPQDGDNIWDEVIWGHTQANDNIEPQVMLHFLISHYLCQYMNLHLGEDFFMVEKDDFINVLGDIILLQRLRGRFHKIYDIWSKSKEDGGLGWLDENQLRIYET